MQDFFLYLKTGIYTGYGKEIFFPKIDLHSKITSVYKDVMSRVFQGVLLKSQLYITSYINFEVNAHV